MYVSTTLTKRQLHKAASSAEFRNDGLTSIKAHTHRAKVEAKATIFFYVIYFLIIFACSLIAFASVMAWPDWTLLSKLYSSKYKRKTASVIWTTLCWSQNIFSELWHDVPGRIVVDHDDDLSPFCVLVRFPSNTDFFRGGPHHLCEMAWNRVSKWFKQKQLPSSDRKHLYF